jgi:Flp pilus assembly protein TadG
VEFALILPLLVTLVLGCVDFGRFAYTYIAVTNAARVGAGVGSVNPVTSSTWSIWAERVRQAVVGEMGAAFDPSKISIPSLTVTSQSDGQKRVRVQVSYPFVTFVTWPFLPNNLTLTRAVEMPMIR